MSHNEDADAIAAHVRKLAAKYIRDECPYMNETALQKILSGLQTTTRDGIVAQYVYLVLAPTSRVHC